MHNSESYFNNHYIYYLWVFWWQSVGIVKWDIKFGPVQICGIESLSHILRAIWGYIQLGESWFHLHLQIISGTSKIVSDSYHYWNICYLKIFFFGCKHRLVSSQDPQQQWIAIWLHRNNMIQQKSSMIM